MKDYSDYPHRHYEIQNSINHTLDLLEDNYKAFNTRLEEREQHYPNHYYYSQKQKIIDAIAYLKQTRDLLGSTDWI
ncbi:hypothetical protein [Chroococcus sp. FPU101]|uniref:hypothetical protein n=1 Tax=Chroococcus sp. FPU101 TaxID=1974212 RepID=UPI001A8FFC0D|nr:hypothetical protein [Chroococcus sp. FPU101]GFE72217.1 hypothetical protein CFPU101_48270 [Chroococcus sp. FPU101]